MSRRSIRRLREREKKSSIKKMDSMQTSRMGLRVRLKKNGSD
jgi:hypothetical protein